MEYAAQHKFTTWLSMYMNKHSAYTKRQDNVRPIYCRLLFTQSLSVTVTVTFCSVSGLCRLWRHITSRLLFKLRFLRSWAIRPAALSPAFRPEIPVHGRLQHDGRLSVPHCHWNRILARHTQLQSDCCHGWMFINLTLTFPRSKWFAPECTKLLNWFANIRKCVAFCDANHLIFITASYHQKLGYTSLTFRLSESDPPHYEFMIWCSIWLQCHFNTRSQAVARIDDRTYCLTADHQI